MKFIKKAFFTCAPLFPIRMLKILSPVRVMLPYYHLVCNTPLPHIRNIYSYKNISQFNKDLDFLLRHFQPIALNDLLEKIHKNEPIPRNTFLLTFDDGLREIHDFVGPLLYRKGVPAVFFLNPAFLDNKDLFYRYKLSLIIERIKHTPVTPETIALINQTLEENSLQTNADIIQNIKNIHYPHRQLADRFGELLSISYNDYLQINQPFLTTGQVEDLINKGFHIGAHSIDHPYYKLIPTQEQIRQTTESCQWIVSHFNLLYKVFAFPHLDKDVKQAFFDELSAGNLPEIDLILGNCNQKQENNRRVLHRFNCENPSLPIQQSIHGILLYNILNKAIHTDEVKRE